MSSERLLWDRLSHRLKPCSVVDRKRVLHRPYAFFVVLERVWDIMPGLHAISIGTQMAKVMAKWRNERCKKCSIFTMGFSTYQRSFGGKIIDYCLWNGTKCFIKECIGQHGNPDPSLMNKILISWVFGLSLPPLSPNHCVRKWCVGIRA